ncbi:RdgB/HAM1 family non-canonical purine NTP pyrophosphatase [Flavihumibacter profundi]|uniref:RdgB/HAM1 family non-canonical purine NTP pyrophosphatase n=1 Tax=Flavihumibacter profundi TaxID=2716883 RepID=UPI001CC7AA31|nr:RdgB/HAM1 family non-canonical purine NTP pyrophosphatase [Flavihumibacter profundi]MBZ5855662.1 RdgB/HAM1 family non-canonical purine NTP pyrophosphatase [Flavihumibacter profundi]
MQIVFATNNVHKIQEIQHILPSSIQLVTLKEGGINIEIPEPHDSLEANAREKSMTIYRLTGKDCFSEDTGLEVETLGGEPGVKSARYAGDQANAAENTRKLLEKLGNNTQRQAQFRTVISLILAGKEYQFEGICKGRIAFTPSGDNGFGYDPVFIPDGDIRTFGDMTMAEKKQFSHRRKATDQLVSFLQQQFK